jgi:rsbT co-antagonist protein RsbR
MASQHLAEVLKKKQDEILPIWVRAQLASAQGSAPGMQSRVREHSGEFLSALCRVASSGLVDDVMAPQWDEVRQVLATVSRSYAEQGLSPVDTAVFVLSLKQPVFEFLRKDLAKTPDVLVDEIWSSTVLLDRLALYTNEVYQNSRNEIIVRQQRELLEISTPVVRLWDSILALPLVGTLDSSRSQVVMEALLEKIVETGAEIAIIDITGVPTVDTLVAQHLIKTVAATRLMGADCIISGIRPQIAQTIVHLGVNLGEVVTKATLADAFAVALKKTNGKLRLPTSG